jgi:hypothetical protein
LFHQPFILFTTKHHLNLKKFTIKNRDIKSPNNIKIIKSIKSSHKDFGLYVIIVIGSDTGVIFGVGSGIVITTGF